MKFIFASTVLIALESFRLSHFSVYFLLIILSLLAYPFFLKALRFAIAGKSNHFPLYYDLFSWLLFKSRCI